MELGRLLAAALGYDVRSADGRKQGSLAGIRYEAHADYPDEIVVHGRWPWQRARVFPLAAVAAVDPRAQTITLRAAS